MKIQGEYHFEVPQALVWELLLDPEALKRSMSGVEHFEETASDVYAFTTRIGLASVRGTYEGNVHVSEKVPPDSYRIRIDGKGKAGGATADALIELSESAGHTSVRYGADVRAQGTIARLGGRLLGGVARLLIGKFFKAMEQQAKERTT